MIDEPVRGGYPDPAVFALPGIELHRRGMVPRNPLSRLTGMQLTQVGTGTATATLAPSPWMMQGDALEVAIPAATTLHAAVMTGLPPATDMKLAALSIHHLRAARSEDGALIARARVLKSGRGVFLAEVWVEDGHGRSVAHATGSVLTEPMAEVPPLRPLRPVEEPRYMTPDPYQRPLPPDFRGPSWDDRKDGLTIMREFLAGTTRVAALELMGARWLRADPGVVAAGLPTSEWLCIERDRISAAALAAFGSMVLFAATVTVSPSGVRPAPLLYTTRFLGRVRPGGGDLKAMARVTDTHDGMVIAAVEISDAQGHVVARGDQTAVLRPGDSSRPHSVTRTLTTVMLTDLVGSTRLARDLGDARWNEFLAEHHAVVRRLLALHNGQEIKTTGDGFLAVFDSPTRAVQCAAAIRDGLRRLGLDVRIGVHSGECDFSEGDVTGVAVHVASRLEAAAEPGQILVSSTVRDLTAGSGLSFVDAGTHYLKDLDGEWTLFGLKS